MLSKDFEEYLKSNYYVDYNAENIKILQKELFNDCIDEIQKIQKEYHFVRDTISHSWDIQSRRVTITASEVLNYGEGICYAKSNLLAVLLRSHKIPTGFCYQKFDYWR